MEYVVDLAQVRKRYRGGVEALRGVSLQVKKGAIFGLLGPNGAGKSTLVKILTTIIRPSHCEGTMLGNRVGHKATLKRVGYLPEHARFPAYLTGRQVIEYSAALAGVPKSEVPDRIKGLLETVGMSDAGDRTIKTYSKGMVQRIGFAQALVNNPELVFLDEPTDGVDPAGRRDMRDLLGRMREEGRTVFVNSHLLGELETVCDSVVILQDGSIVKQGTLEELTQSSRHFEIQTVNAIPSELRTQITQDGHKVDGHRILVEGTDPAPVQPIIDALRAAGLTIASIDQARQSLEDLFLETVEQQTPPPLPA